MSDRQRSVLNPTSTDFTVFYDLDGTGNPQEWTARGLEYTEFPEAVALHVAKHLADKILFGRDRVSDWDKEHAEVMAELLPTPEHTTWEDAFDEK